MVVGWWVVGGGWLVDDVVVVVVVYVCVCDGWKVGAFNSNWKDTRCMENFGKSSTLPVLELVTLVSCLFAEG